ncbi:MAG: hypothetical protein IRY99_24965, partial [Isosphaeraceae bacterium]|nr:hypothetical protein [Isosphaeraceae bacterium]
YAVAIRNNTTGEVRVADVDLAWREGRDGSRWWWTGGNFGCDCNRRLVFERAGGVDIDPASVECGDGGYSVLWVELPDGRHVPIEGTP